MKKVTYKKYTAQEIERAIIHLEKDENDTLLDVFFVDNSPVELRISDFAAILRQAADAEEKNAQLKARLDEVVKNLEDMRKRCAFAYIDQEDSVRGPNQET